ncbi:FAD binding domain-containing protein [Microbispora hainanensis]|uniref:FAD binding domain-containing protein n=1 Tax=Microbispora hainanensis TaxID=568844 RepID=UPI0032531381
MRPAAFDYVRPRSLEETLAHLAGNRHARVLAGGQSLVPLLNRRAARPGTLVDINAVAGLDVLRWDDDALHIGATVRQRRVELDADVRARIPILSEATALIGRIAIRNRGTIVGSLTHADPSAELPAVAVACRAEVSIASAAGLRTCPAGEFFLGANHTSLALGEMAIGVRFPLPPPRTGQAWVEYSRRHADLPLVGVACELTLTAGGVIADATLVCAGVGPRPWRVPAAASLIGAAPEASAEASAASPEAFRAVARAAAVQCEPYGDARTDAAHRRRLVYALTLRSLETAWSRAGEQR